MLYNENNLTLKKKKRCQWSFFPSHHIHWPLHWVFSVSLWDGAHAACAVPCHLGHHSLLDISCVPESVCPRLMRHLFSIKKLFKNTLLIIMGCIWLIISTWLTHIFWKVQSRFFFPTGYYPNLIRIHISYHPIIHQSELSSWGAVNFEKLAWSSLL